ncbi:hypothetical protein [Phascolarctobacterium sp.]
MTFDTKMPKAQDEMTPAEFDAMMTRGLAEAQADLSQPAAAVFMALRQKD